MPDDLTSRLVGSEAPLLAFVSGVMDEDTRSTRQEAFDALVSLGLRPWLFEMTPPSGDPPDVTYLRKVRECDVFIWIAAGRTTQPVQDEIDTAIEAGRHIIAIRMPSDDEDQLTLDLFTQLSPKVKWYGATRGQSVEDLIEIALSDLVTEAVRHAPASYSFDRWLDDLQARSTARCQASWQVLGVEGALAMELARDESVGDCLTTSIGADDLGVFVVTGPAGAGKSLSSERLHQRAIERARADGPEPFWLRAAQITRPLDEELKALASTYTDLRANGAHVVIEEAHRIGPAVTDLLAEARAIVETWPGSTVIVTGQPTLLLQQTPEHRTMPPLSETEAATLMAMMGVPPERIPRLPPVLADACRLPLFAILLGKEEELSLAPHELLANLLRRMLVSRVHSVEETEELTALAVATMRRAGAVPLNEAPTSINLAGTGLLELTEQNVSFALPIIEVYFAARALVTDHSLLKTVLGSTLETSQWYQALSLAIAQVGHDDLLRMFSEVADDRPDLMGRLLGDSITRGSTGHVADMPPSSTAARQLREAMGVFVHALGPAAPLCCPVGPHDGLSTLALESLTDGVRTAWWEGLTPLDDPVVDAANLKAGPGWRSVQWQRNAGRSGWAWKVALEEVQRNLAETLKDRAIPTAPSLQAEADWALACEMSERSGFRLQDVPVAELDWYREFARPDDDAGTIMFAAPRGRTYPARAVSEALTRFSSIDVVAYPWPPPDETVHGWLPVFSLEQAANHISAVFLAGVNGYAELVGREFSNLAPFLSTNILLPVEIQLFVSISDNDWSDFRRFDLWWRLWPKDSGPTSVTVTLDEVPDWWVASGREREPLGPALRALRGEAASLVRFHEHHTGFDMRELRPAESVAFSILQSDLKQLGLLG